MPEPVDSSVSLATHLQLDADVTTEEGKLDSINAANGGVSSDADRGRRSEEASNDGDGNAESLSDSEPIGGSRPVVPISKEAWDSIPKNCLIRVVEFQSIREEYQRTHETTVAQSLFDDAEN